MQQALRMWLSLATDTGNSTLHLGPFPLRLFNFDSAEAYYAKHVYRFAFQPGQLSFPRKRESRTDSGMTPSPLDSGSHIRRGFLRKDAHTWQKSWCSFSPGSCWLHWEIFREFN